MFSLFKCNFCIQNQMELASNIAYSNYLLCTVRSDFLQSVWFHTWLGCSLSPFSCSSSVFQWDFGGSLKCSLNFMVCSTQTKLLKEDGALQVWRAPGASHWSCWGQGRWSPFLHEVCAGGGSVSPSYGAGIGHQTVQWQRLQKEMDQIFLETLQLQKPKPTTTLKEMKAESVIIGLENSLLRYGRAGSLWLLATGGRLILHLQFCKYRMDSVLWLQVRDWKLCLIMCLS